MHLVDQTHPVILWEGEKAGGDLNHVKAHVFALVKVAVHGCLGVGLREDMLDPAALDERYESA